MTIRLDLDTARRLGLVVQGGFEARRLEVGGLLLGRLTPEDKSTTVIEDFEPFESEHRRGPSYTLSETDRRRLQKRLSAHANRRDLRVVGYWRSHTRPGLYLDQEDYSVILTYFKDPSQVFLLVKPSTAGSRVSGFFFWEDGDIRRDSPYEEFLFDGGRLPVADDCIVSSPDSLALGACRPDPPGWLSPDPATPGNPEENINKVRLRTPASDERTASFAWPSAIPAKVENPERRSYAPTASAMDAPMEHAAAAAGSAWAASSRRPGFSGLGAPISDRDPARSTGANPGLETAENPQGFRGGPSSRPAVWQFRLSAPRWIWVASAAVLLSILIVRGLVIRSVSRPVVSATTQPAPTRTVAPPADARPSMFSQFSLNVEPTEHALRLGWNRNSPIIQNAPAAVLWVTDGAQHLRVDLDKRLLSSGSIVYVPTEGDVEFELEVFANGRLVSESVRALVPGGPRPPGPTAGLTSAPLPSVNPTAEPPELQLMQNSARMGRQPALPPGKSVARADVKSFHPPAPQSGPQVSGQSPVVALAPPPILAPAPLNAPAGLPADKLYETATITYEPMRPPALERVFQKLPGLRRLQRFEEGEGKDFVPAKPRHELAFLVPAATGRERASRKPVNLKVSLDESGKVIRVEQLSKGPMAGVAAHAALAWQFTPARWKDKPVASEVIVHLRFGGDAGSTAASAVQHSVPGSAPRGK